MAEHTGNPGHTICDYEGTSYRSWFWEGQGRSYEDLAERIALRRLLPPRGKRLLEVGAGFGRLADLYEGYDQVILLDYAKSGLREAQERFGQSGRFLYIAANLYHLPIAIGSCDTVVTVRVLHHVADIPAALRGIAKVLRPGGVYVLEYANKRNAKAIARYLFGRQRWSPFALQPYEFTELNYDFHPTWMVRTLAQAGFTVEAGLSVSHFRQALIKRLVPAPLLANLDGMVQRVGAAWKLTPSVFLRVRAGGAGDAASPSGREGLFCCPSCTSPDLENAPDALICRQCGAVWGISEGIYDFKTPR